MMEFLNILQIVVLLAIGLVICWEDFKFSKIRNKWIGWGFIAGLVINLAAIIFLVITRQPIDWHNYLQIAINFAVAFILAFILWYFKLWAGGDAKLFSLFVFLLPASYYANFYFPYWQPLALLTNIILPIFIYLLIKFLLYPFQFLFNYLKNPRQLKEYFGKAKSGFKLDKKKAKDYLATALSFVIIFILFQIMRQRFYDLFNPYLGKLVTLIYFFLGFIIWQPLRKILQKQLILAAILIAIYFIVGAIYFPGLIYTDIHQLLAWQFIFMLSFYYLFKYGKAFGSFLYNSAEVKMVSLEALSAGMYINKEYVKQTMGNRHNLQMFQREIAGILDEKEQLDLNQLIKSKISGQVKERQQSQIISIFYKFRPQAILYLLTALFDYKKNKKLEDTLILSIRPKLDEKQNIQLDNILQQTDDVKEFLKTIRGKLTDMQAKRLKEMISQRNEEIIALGLSPIDKIVLHKTFAFAPFMLLGVIITLITKTSLIHSVYQWIGR